MLLILAILVIMGWRVAGYIGLDRILLPLLGTPWQHNLSASVQAIREGSLPEAPGRPRIGPHRQASRNARRGSLSARWFDGSSESSLFPSENAINGEMTPRP